MIPLKYFKTNGIHIVEIPVDDFKIMMVDSKKKSASKENYANAGFFGVYKGASGNFTLPVGHLVCDFNAPSETEKYCTERGKFKGDKFSFNGSAFSYMNQFYGNAISTLIIASGKASVMEIKDLSSNCDYAISGIPIMRNGNDVKFATDVKNQGWDESTLYATWHMFVGLKSNKSKVYLIGMRTMSWNMIRTAEAYKKFKKLGFVDVLKLDGGGSFILNVNGRAVASTTENRRINTIITFCSNTENPYPVPTMTLRRGSRCPEQIKWLQWQLNSFGFDCEIDGSFGPNTLKQVKAFQKSVRLEQDGSVGPATRAALNK